MIDIKHLSWENSSVMKGFSYVCGYCGCKTAPSQAYSSDLEVPISPYQAYGFICSDCNRLSYAVVHYSDKTLYEIYPSPMIGDDIDGLPPDVQSLYNEARKATSVSSHTAAVLTCRKILMHVAHDKGANEGLHFIQYVNYLADNNYIPQGGLGWVDYIREKSNEANHQIVIMSPDDSKTLIDFTEMLLRMIYEFESRLPRQQTNNQA